MFKILRFLALILVASGCHSQSGFSKCETLMAEVSKLSAPVLITAPNPRESAIGDSYEVLDTDAGYKLVTLNQNGFRHYFSQLENEIDDSMLLDMASSLNVSAPNIPTLWDGFLFSAKHRLKVDGLACDAHLDEGEKQLLLFYFLYGSEIWSSGERVLDLVLDEGRQFLFFVSRVNENIYSGRLVQVNNGGLASYLIFYSDRDMLHMVLYKTASLNLKNKSANTGKRKYRDTHNFFQKNLKINLRAKRVNTSLV
ncbi:hypothetical protein [Aliikangiella sp. IMCC44632]